MCCGRGTLGACSPCQARVWGLTGAADTAKYCFLASRQARSDLMALKEEETALRAEAEKMQAEATAEAAAVTNEDDVFL